MKRRVSRAIVEMIARPLEADNAVTISRLADGSVTYSVRASGSSLKVARERAQEAFTALKKYAEGKL